jgi:hypothetical protein
MPKNTARLGKNGMKITTISALIYESKLALPDANSFFYEQKAHVTYLKLKHVLVSNL